MVAASAPIVAAPEIRKEQTVNCDPLHGGQRRFIKQPLNLGF
jgi:hypothetical protein